MPDKEDLVWKGWKPGDPLYVVGWEAPSGDLSWSLSPSPSHAGWLTALYADSGAPMGGLPEAAARALLEAYTFAHRFPPLLDATGDAGV